MIVLRQNNYSSFLEKLKGNPKLKTEMFKAIKGGSIDRNLPKELPDDLKRYITFLKNNISKDTTMSGDKNSGTVFKIYGYNSVINQLENNKIPSNIRRTEIDRVVLFQSKSYLLYYDVEQKNYVISNESGRFNLIGRAVDKLFNPSEEKKKVVTSKSLISAIEWMFRSIVTNYYYY